MSLIRHPQRSNEPDELLKYAHVQREVKKFYAFKYKGYADELPYFFCQRLADRSVSKARHRIDELEFRVVDGSRSMCYVGDYIVVSANGDTEIMNERDFHDTYMHVEELSLENK